ncbi:MAG: hypothetical protein WA874_20120 [Chryseosolibacter sp.]
MINSVLKILCLGIFVLLLGIPSFAQNTKGDKPAPAQRDTRFKTPKKSKPKNQPSLKVKRKGDDRAGRRVSPPATRNNGGERPGKPVRPLFSRSKPKDEQKPWKGDITNRRIQPRSAASRARNVYPQPGTTNYSSLSMKRKPRENQNPNVKRVRQMQQEDRGRPKVGRPIRPTYHSRRPQEQQHPWRGDITGRRIRAKTSDNISSPSVPRRTSGTNQYRRQGSGTPPRTIAGGSYRRKAGASVAPRISGRARNMGWGRSYYVNSQARRNRMPGGGNRLAGGYLSQPRPGVKYRKVVPRSASSSFLARRSTNTWAHFAKPRRKQKTFTTDLAGKKLRTKNFETQRPILGNPTLKYQKRIAAGERPYNGPATGGYVSRSRTGQRAWKGDITGRNIRGGKPPQGERAFLGILKGGGFRTASRPHRPGMPVPGRSPGVGTTRIAKYQGNIRQRRGFNDQGEGYTGNIKTGRRGFGDQGEEYTGNIRRGQRGFNNQGEGYTGNMKAGRRGFSDQGEQYTGNIKARRSDQGGGSRSGKLWNNNNTPIVVRTPSGKGARSVGYQGNIKAGKRILHDQGEGYTGNIKFRRTDKGGGSISGKLWNNAGRPIVGRDYSSQSVKVSRYSGNIKARRPDKGGGSISGRLWNNEERPLAGRDYSSQSAKVSRYSGNMKARRPEKGGGSVSGKLWNNEERPIPGRDYSSQAAKVSRYTGNLRARRPEKGGGSVSGKLWNNKQEPIAVREPKDKWSGDYAGDVKISRNHYSRNPKSAKEALPGQKASAAARKADLYARGVRRDWDYIRNPSSADAAQRKREPGRAFYRSGDYQGNIKYQRYDLFGKRGLHPDAQFVKLNKNNVAEEKDLLTNFKLWWARLFKKEETQPDHLKEKGRTPRYDKGEAGLWYE